MPDTLEKQLFHLQAQRFESPQSAQAALATLSGSWRYHQTATTELIEHKRYASKGRPSAKSPIKAIEWQIRAQVRPDAEAICRQKQYRGEWHFLKSEGIVNFKVRSITASLVRSCDMEPT